MTINIALDVSEHYEAMYKEMMESGEVEDSLEDALEPQAEQIIHNAYQQFKANAGQS